MSRRGKDEGSIHQRKDGRWVGVLDIGWTNGKRDRKYVYGKTRFEVSRKLAQALKAKEDGVLARNERTTLEQFLKQWLEDRKVTVRPGTWKRYEQLSRTHVIPHIGRIPLTKLQPQHLQRLYTNRIQSGLSPTTTLQIHRMLHKALSEAARWGLVSRNVASVVNPPKKVAHTVEPLTPSQATRLLETARGNRLEALYVTALMTGMREGELLGLMWRDVDLDKGIITVRRTLAVAVESGYELGPTKTLRSTRSLLLARPAIQALTRHRIQQEKEIAASWGAWAPFDLVFTNIAGNPLNPSNLRLRSFYPLLEQAGLPQIRFHDLRHTAASLLLGEGVHPKIVSEMLGHSQIGITLDLYSHVSQTMLEQARTAFDDIFGCQNGCQSDEEGDDGCAPIPV